MHDIQYQHFPPNAVFGTKIEVVANWYFLNEETLYILRQQEVEEQIRWQITIDTHVGLYGLFISEYALVKVYPKTPAHLAPAQSCKNHFAPETKSKVDPKKIAGTGHLQC